MNYERPQLARRRERSLYIARGVAILFHRPGLRVLYGISVPRTVRTKNRVALTLTGSVALFATAYAPKPHCLQVLFAIWLIGHFIWGLYLSLLLTSVQRGESGHSSIVIPGE